MLTATYAQLHAFMQDDYDNLSAELVKALHGLDVNPIIADQSMSENHIGGDDILTAVAGVVSAIKGGYEIVTWYGPATEVLVVGVRPGAITLTDPELSVTVEEHDS